MTESSSSAAPLRTLSPAPSGVSATTNKTMSGVKQTNAKTAARKAAAFSTAPFWMGLFLSAGWIVVVALAMISAGAAQTFAGLPMAHWAIGISAIVSPMAMIWMVAAYLQRAADVQSVTEPLRRQLAMITGESGVAEVRIRRFNQAIKEQLDLLRSTKTLGDGELMALLDRLSEHKADLEAFEQNSLYHVQEIQDVIHRSMQHIDQLMEDKFAMLRILDGKLVQSGEDMSRQTQTMREQVTALLQDVESNALLVASSVERAMQDSRKLSDTARAQETSLLSAAENASSTLSELSGKIDANIAHFLGRAGVAREEAERLASALDAQTRSIDEFSNLLPSRVSEAEAVLRGVADRLYASEQLAREQANVLSEKLSGQAENLQALLERFATRVNDIDGALQQRRSDLDGLVVRISAASTDLAGQLDGSVAKLGVHADGTLKRFEAANEEARRGTDAITAQLAETAARYEAATRHLGSVSEANSTQVRALSHEITQQLEQFESLHRASQQAGHDVQLRAGAALQNMQQLLDRLLATRDASQGVGDALTEKLRGAVEQNERVITRINEAARMTVHALGLAAETLGRQEEGITEKTRSAESALQTTIAQMEAQAAAAQAALRSHNDSLTIMLADVRERLDQTDRRLQDFADYASAPVQQAVGQIERSTEQGRESIARYGADMQGQLERLQAFNAQVGSMGQDVGRMTSETLNAIEDTNRRFVTLRDEQEQTTRRLMDGFAVVAEKIHTEIGALGGQAEGASSSLRQAAEQIGQQTHTLQSEAQETGAKIQFVTTVLQNEASALKTALESQASAINAELSRAGSQFKDIEKTLRERTDATYALLDRVATHYNEVTRLASEDLDRRADKLGSSANEATGKVQALSTAMESQLSLINAGAAQMEGNAGRIVASGAQTLSRLEEVNAKLSVTQETAIQGTNRAVDRLEESLSAFKMEQETLSETATATAAAILQASTSFGEQASRMLDATHQVEGSVNGLNVSIAGVAETSSQVRSVMEQQNARLISGLKESVEQIDGVNMRLQQTSAAAILSADQAGARFAAVTDDASSRIGATTQELFKTADKAQTVLGALSADVTRQVAALNVVSEQIAQQHKQLTASGEAQRSQMLDLFEKLGRAHEESSSVAERTLARLGEVLAKLEGHLGEMSSASTGTLSTVTSATQGFSDQAVALIDHAKKAEEQARSALQVTSSLQDQAGKLREALGEETARATDLMQALLARLTAGSGEVRSLSDQANTALTDLQAGLARQTSSLNESMDHIAQRSQTLNQALDSQREALSGLITRLIAAQDETAEGAGRAANRLGEGARQILVNVDSIDARASAAATTLQAAGETLAKEMTALVSHAQAAEQQTSQLMACVESAEKQSDKACERLRAQALETGETLSCATEKTLTAVDSLREGSRAAQTAVGTLGDTVAQQTSAMGAQLAAIEDRQGSLSAAMDVQRGALGEMVTRLTLAQDETAAAAERSAARLTDSAGQIARQMDALDHQAQGALASLRDVNAGLTEEATTIGRHTKQAEEQVRDMLKATSGMNQEARAIRESIKGESDQLIDQVRSIIAQLDGTVSQLKQQSGTIANVMDKSAMDFSTVARTSSETLQKQSDALSLIAQQAQGRMDSVNEKIRESAKLIADAGDLAEDNGLRLAETAEKSTSRLVALIATMNEGDGEARTIVERAALRLTDTRATLEKELQNIAELSERAAQSVMGAGSSLSIQSDALRANLAASESALVQAADTVREETVQLPTLLARSASSIDSTAKTFKSQTADIADTMLKTTDRCIGAAGAVRDTMMDEAKHLTNVANLADQTLRQFNEALLSQIGALKTGAGALSEEQRALVENASQTVAQLAQAGDRLTLLREDAQKTASRLTQDFEAAEARASATTQRLAAAGDTLSKQVEALAAMTEKAEGKMTGASHGFREQLERVRAGVQTQIDDINRGLMQITAQLDRTGSSLRTAMAGTVVDVEKIAGRFDQTSKETAAQLTDRTTRMRAATEEVAKLVGGFSNQLETLLDRMGLASENIKRHDTDLVGHLQQAFSHLGGVADRLQSTRALADNVSEAATTKLSDVAAQVEKQMRHLAEGGQAVTGIIQSVAQAYADQVGRVSAGVTSSKDQINAMSAMVEDMQQRMDRMRVTLKLQGDELLLSMENIQSQLAHTGDVMSGAVESSLREKAMNSLKKIS